MSNLKHAIVKCACGFESTTPYLYADDVWLNRVDCACGRKFIPKYARFPEDKQNPVFSEKDLEKENK